MATTMERRETNDLGRTLESVGEKVIRYGLVAILLVGWGGVKFTAYEPRHSGIGR